MAGYNYEAIRDLLTTTIKNLGPNAWTDIVLDLQELIAMPNILQKEKVSFDGGVGVQRTLMVDHSRNAKHTMPYDTDSTSVRDVFKTISIPWRHCVTSWAVDKLEVAMNKGAQRIVDLVKARRVDAMTSLAMLMEDDFWNVNVSDDGLTPFGLPYWIVRYPTGTTTPGFTGKNHPNFTKGPGGLDASDDTNKRWRNWAGQYTNVSKDDLIKKMREAYAKIQFKPPVPFPEDKRGSDRYSIYMNYATLAAMERLGEDQNENLGKDVASMDGQMTFRGVKMKYVPYLDNDTGSPVYMVNWATFYPVFLKGEYLNESEPIMSPEQHTVTRVFVDLTTNYLCTNRRVNAVFSTAAQPGS